MQFVLNCDRSTVKDALQNTQNDCYTSGFLTALEHSTKFDFGRGFAPKPAGGAYSAPPNPLARLRGLLLRGGEGKVWERRGEKREEIGEGQGTEKWKGRGRDARGRGGKERKKEGNE